MTSVSKTEEPMHSSGKRGDLEEITENIEGNLEEDTKSSVSREEEIPQEEEENLNESSGEDEEMYSWDELEYKANYVRFISNESTEKQVRIASAVVNKLEAEQGSKKDPGHCGNAMITNLSLYSGR